MELPLALAHALGVDAEGVAVDIDAVAVDGSFLCAHVHHGVVLQDEMHVAAEVDGLAVVERAIGHIPCFLACRAERGFRAGEQGVIGALQRFAVLANVADYQGKCRIDGHIPIGHGERIAVVVVASK